MKIRRLFFLLLSLLMILGMGSQQTLAQDELDFEGQIAYVGTDGNIWVRLGGGDSAFPVTYDASESKRYASPRWSPDGLKLAYCQLNSQDGGGGQLYVSRSGEWQPFLLTEDLYCKSMPGGSLSWSPDGRQIVYARTFEYTAQSSSAPWDPYNGIWAVDAITGEVSELIQPPGSNPLVSPQWSPDGEWIKLYEIAYIEGLGVFRIWNNETGSLDSWLGLDGEVFPGFSGWSSDGSQIVFDVVTYVGFPGAGLYTASPSGEGLTKIYSNSNRVAMYPLWSPDGKYIAFEASKYGGESARIILVTPDGSEQLEIYSGETSAIPLAWSPTGSQLLFASREEDHFNLHLYDIESGMRSQLGVAGEIGSDWSQLPPLTENTGDMALEVVPDFPLNNDLLIFVAPDYRLVLYKPSSGQEISLSEPMAVAGFTPSPSGKKLVYNRRLVSLDFRDDGNLVIQTTPLTTTPLAGKISWPPDESRMAYEDQAGQVWIVDQAGNTLEVPGASQAPSWSFDGQWLSYCDGENALWVFGPDSPPQEVAKGVDCQSIWSPSQNVVAFTQLQTGDEVSEQAFIYNTASEQATLVMQDSRVEGWSPDGKYLAVRQPEEPGTSQMMYIIIAVDPESEKKLFVGSFQEGEAGEQEWRPYEEGYLFGPYHIKHDLSSASRVSETLFDASADLKRLLIGIGEGDQVTVACLDVTNGEKETQQTVYLAGFDDTEEAGIWGSLSPDGEWIALAAYDRGNFTNTLRRCDREQEISIEGDPSVAIGDFSGNSRWYVYPQSMPEGGEGLLLLDLELEESESIGTINGSPMYWVKSPISSEIIETYPITGMVSTESGEPLQGVAIMIDGIQLTETGVDGTFTISGLQADTYTLSPLKDGATFTPESRSVRLPRDASENDFVGSGIEGSAPVETLNPTESSLPTETPIQEVSELESNFPIVLPATQLTDETTLLLIAICGGGLLVLGLLFFVVYLIRRSLRKRSAQETPKDPNAIVPEPSEAEVMEWLQEGAALVKGGDIDTGEAKLRQVIEYAPENPSAWMWMGWSAAQRGDRRTAEQCFKRAKTLKHPKAEKALKWLERKG